MIAHLMIDSFKMEKHGNQTCWKSSIESNSANFSSPFHQMKICHSLADLPTLTSLRGRRKRGRGWGATEGRKNEGAHLFSPLSFPIPYSDKLSRFDRKTHVWGISSWSHGLASKSHAQSETPEIAKQLR